MIIRSGGRPTAGHAIKVGDHTSASASGEGSHDPPHAAHTDRAARRVSCNEGRRRRTRAGAACCSSGPDDVPSQRTQCPCPSAGTFSYRSRRNASNSGRRTREVRNMSTLIAIGYADEQTATAAADEVQRLAADLIIEPDAVAAIRRDREGKFHVTTNHHAVGGGASWGMFWGLLFGLLFFIPVFGMALGAGLGALMGKVEKSGIDKAFQDQVRDMLQPGTSALFLVVEKVTPDKAIAGLSQFGGTVLKSSLSAKAEAELQKELHGTPAPV